MSLLRETLKSVEVMCVTADLKPSGIKDSWDRLEHVLASLKRRKFYGAFFFPDGPYRACVAVLPGDEPAAMGLERWTFPGGLYLRRRLVDWQDDPDRIGITFGEMSAQVHPDGERPNLEYYRRHDEVILYLPIQA